MLPTHTPEEPYISGITDTGGYDIGAQKVLDISGGTAFAGASVIQWTAHGGLNQKWYLEDANDGYFYVRSALNGYALDVTGNTATDGTGLIVWPFHGDSNQKWKFSNFGAGLG